MTAHRLKRWLMVIAFAAPWLVVWPSPNGLRGRSQELDAPLDEALRVPFAATFLRTANPAFESHDRILDIAFEGEEQLIPPRNRQELRLALSESPAGPVSIRLMRGRDPLTVRASTVTASGWRAVTACGGA